MSSNNDAEYDDRGRPMNDGTRGPAFRAYKRDFLALARGRFAKDDRHSFFEAYLRVDEGGTGAGAPAFPAQAGGAGGGVNPAYNQARVKYKTRQGQAYTYLYESQSDPNIKQMLSDLSETNPAELAGDAWDLVLAECDEPSDDLEVAKMDVIWTTTSVLNTVGY